MLIAMFIRQSTRSPLMCTKLQQGEINAVVLPFDMCKVNAVQTSSSAIAERPRCRVGQLWPKVEEDILKTI